MRSRGNTAHVREEAPYDIPRAVALCTNWTYHHPVMAQGHTAATVFDVSFHGDDAEGMATAKQPFVVRKRANAMRQRPEARRGDGQQTSIMQQTVMRVYIFKNYGARFGSAARNCYTRSHAFQQPGSRKPTGGRRRLPRESNIKCHNPFCPIVSFNGKRSL